MNWHFVKKFSIYISTNRKMQLKQKKKQICMQSMYFVKYYTTLVYSDVACAFPFYGNQTGTIVLFFSWQGRQNKRARKHLGLPQFDSPVIIFKRVCFLTLSGPAFFWSVPWYLSPEAPEELVLNMTIVPITEDYFEVYNISVAQNWTIMRFC